MNVSLTPQLERYLRQKVKTGQYTTVSEVVREALRLLEEKDQLREIRLKALREEIAIGIRQLDRGEGKPLDIDRIKATVRRKLARERRRR